MAKKFAILFGVVFVLVGILGFIPNPIVGATGLFLTDTLHNLVHLVIGLVLLIVAFSAPAKSSLWLKIFGVVYLLLVVLGFLLIPHGGKLLGLVTMNTADHFLHLVLGVVLLAASMWGRQLVFILDANGVNDVVDLFSAKRPRILRGRFAIWRTKKSRIFSYFCNRNLNC